MPPPASKVGRHNMFGNQNGLPGLPKTNYITRRPIRQTGAAPSPPPQRFRPPPTRPSFAQPPPPVLAQPPLMPAGPDPFVTRRLDILEQRLNSSEQGNRTLLDELMRLQQDMKIQVKKNEMGLSEEREVKVRLEVAMRQGQGQQYELEDRIRRHEEALKESRQAVQQVSAHTHSVEKLLSSIQQDQMEKSTAGTHLMQEQKHEVLRLVQENEQLGRVCTSLRDDNTATQNQLDTVKQDLATLQNNVKLQARLLQENSTAAKIPQTSSSRNMSETERSLLEGKIISLNTAIQGMSERLTAEAKKREKVENDVNTRLNEMLQDVGKSRLDKEKELREVEDKLNKLQAGFSQAEKQRILTEISSVANDLQRQMDKKEAKLRDDTVNKLTVIEKTLLEENQRRAEKEKDLEENIERGMNAAQMKGDASSDNLNEVFRTHEQNSQDRIAEVTKRMNEVEDEIRQHKLEHDKVLSAEINERKNEDKIVNGKLDDMDHDLKVATNSLQNDIGQLGAAARTDPAKDKQAEEDRNRRDKQLTEMQAKNDESIRTSLAKELSGLDQRLHKVETNTRQQDDRISSQLQAAQSEEQEAKAFMGDKIQSQIDDISFKQTKIRQQVDALEDRVKDTPKAVDHLKKKVDDVDNKVNKKVDYEVKERKENCEELRDDIETIIGRKDMDGNAVPSLAQLQNGVDLSHTSMKKLAEAIHVVKSSLVDRIRDEKKFREQEITILKRDVDRLDTKYHDIKERIKAGDVLDTEEDDYAN